ncbi:MAG TPA: hypothetical protein VGJ15_05350 [Pirellulales bacterium]|jgi:hypothetical protein
MRRQFGLKQLLLFIFLQAVGIGLLRFVFDPAIDMYTPMAVAWRMVAGILAGMVLAVAIAALAGWMGAAKRIVGSLAFIACFVTGALCSTQLSAEAAMSLPQDVYQSTYHYSLRADYARCGMMATLFAAALVTSIMVLMWREKPKAASEGNSKIAA